MAQPEPDFLEDHRAAVDALMRRALKIHREAINEKARMDELMPSFYASSRKKPDF